MLPPPETDFVPEGASLVATAAGWVYSADGFGERVRWEWHQGCVCRGDRGVCPGRGFVSGLEASGESLVEPADDAMTGVGDKKRSSARPAHIAGR